MVHEIPEVIINDNKLECYICLNNIETDLINIVCKCTKNSIHGQCLFLLFANQISNCTICKTQINIKDYFNKDQIIILFNNLDMLERSKYIMCINDIIKNQYCYDIHIKNNKIVNCNKKYHLLIKNCIIFIKQRKFYSMLIQVTMFCMSLIIILCIININTHSL